MRYMKDGHSSVGQLAKLGNSHWENCVLLQPGLEVSEAYLGCALVMVLLPCVWHLGWDDWGWFRHTFHLVSLHGCLRLPAVLV